MVGKPAFTYFICFALLALHTRAQMKFLIDDFEGYANGAHDLARNGVFTYGNATANVLSNGSPAFQPGKADPVGQRWMRITKKNEDIFAGYGKGTSVLVQLNASTDVFCFFARLKSVKDRKIKLSLQEDDNADNIFKKENDDQWVYEYQMKAGSTDDWQLVSIPLQQFKDETHGGDGIFNCNYKEGKLLCVLISFEENHPLKQGEWLDLDQMCFSKGTLEEARNKSEGCVLGLWSAEGNQANFTEIGTAFEQMYGKDKKLAVIHFFQPFSADGTDQFSQYPSVERVNKVIGQGYTPMITLENHYVNVNSNMKQPNLYSIIEGHMDAFFIKWATEVKQMNGAVWVRILHEFNGDWYPWCIVNNDKDPALFIKAYRHIHDIFTSHGAKNVKFIWCPNSMSLPQEGWNFIMDAYPGDGYVDMVGMDAYNGAGDATIWSSFKRVAIENYFLFSQQLPTKPILICETASRERAAAEGGPSQTKAEWIRQMSQTLQSDMTQIKLLSWFNEKGTFKLNSSPGAKKAFEESVIKSDHFKSGATTWSELTEN